MMFRFNYVKVHYTHLIFWILFDHTLIIIIDPQFTSV